MRSVTEPGWAPVKRIDEVEDWLLRDFLHFVCRKLKASPLEVANSGLNHETVSTLLWEEYTRCYQRRHTFRAVYCKLFKGK